MKAIENQYRKDIWFWVVAVFLFFYFPLLFYLLYGFLFDNVLWEFTMGCSPFCLAALLRKRLLIGGHRLFFSFFWWPTFHIFFCRFIYLMVVFLFSFSVRFPFVARLKQVTITFKHFSRNVYGWKNVYVALVVKLKYMRKQIVNCTVFVCALCSVFVFCWDFLASSILFCWGMLMKRRSRKTKNKLKQQCHWLLYGDGLIDWFITIVNCVCFQAYSAYVLWMMPSIIA